jgi:hypothetical protein
VRTYAGILDDAVFPANLTAHVTMPTPDPRIHGYAVQADLARHVGFVDLGWLAMTGELPVEAEREALSLALLWLAPMHVGEDPAHAGVLAKVAGAPDAMVPAIVAVALGQRIGAELRALAPMFAWLDGALPGPPSVAVLADDATAEQRDAYAQLARDSARWFGADALPTEPALTRVAGAYAVLHRLGIRDPARLHALVTWARLPVALAEAACTAPGSVNSYPADLPAYRYVEEDAP